VKGIITSVFFFRNVTQCGLKYQRFGEAGCLHIQGCPIRWAFGCDGYIYFLFFYFLATCTWLCRWNV